MGGNRPWGEPSSQREGDGSREVDLDRAGGAILHTVFSKKLIGKGTWREITKNKL